jgi:hypothetical protein
VQTRDLARPHERADTSSVKVVPLGLDWRVKAPRVSARLTVLGCTPSSSTIFRRWHHASPVLLLP